MTTASVPLPIGSTYVLIPVVNLVLAFLVSGFVIWLIARIRSMRWCCCFRAALGNGEGIGFTLFYATSFIFTGLGRCRCSCRVVQHRSEARPISAASAVALIALALDHYVPW